MNPVTARIAMKGAGSALSYFRTLDKSRQREIYDSIIDAIKDGEVENVEDLANIDELEGLYSAARREAGDLTRAAHDRLDRRRAAFAAAAPSRKERREALKAEAKTAKQKSSNTPLKILAGLGAAGAAAATGWAVWEFFLKEKLAGDKKEDVTYTRVQPREETDSRGRTTLVYSTRTEDAGTKDAHTNDAGPLGEDPAERDEELLSSIDDQLDTLDTLEDNQRTVTENRHEKGDA